MSAIDYAVQQYRSRHAAQARVELAQLRATIALNRYVIPPFDLTDDDTVRLALKCAAKDDIITDQAMEIAQLRARIVTLESSQIDHDNDCAVLPEDVSVTEYVTQLRAAQAALSNLLAGIHGDGGQHEQEHGAIESARLAEAIEQARHKLRSTQRNWDEQCLYDIDDILTKALADHLALVKDEAAV